MQSGTVSRREEVSCSVQEETAQALTGTAGKRGSRANVSCHCVQPARHPAPLTLLRTFMYESAAHRHGDELPSRHVALSHGPRTDSPLGQLAAVLLGHVLEVVRMLVLDLLDPVGALPVVSLCKGATNALRGARTSKRTTRAPGTQT